MLVKHKPRLCVCNLNFKIYSILTQHNNSTTPVTRSTGTMYTSAKACLTSGMFWMRICDRDRHQNLTILPTFLENLMQMHLEIFVQSC